MEATHVRRSSPGLAIWLGLFVVLNIADLVSTELALNVGMQEGNPLMSALLHRYGFPALIVYKLGVILVVGVGVLLLRRYHRRLAGITLLVCNILVLVAVLLNIIQFNMV
jgi:positive regulator of sigma E activity